MGEMIRVTSGQATLAASEANFCTAASDTVGALPGELYDGPDMFRIVSGLPNPFSNGVARARLSPASVDEQIDWTLRHFDVHKVSMTWYLTSSSQPADLGVRLEAHGLSLVETLPEMVADLGAIPDTTFIPPTCRVIEVRTPEHLVVANQIIATGFGMSKEIARAMTQRMAQVGYGDEYPLHLFLGLLDSKPVSSAALHLSHGIAGIYDVATLPEARRQGIGAAVTLGALHVARDRGYHVASLQASQMGLPVYARLGFEVRYQIPVYRWPGLDKPAE